MKAYEREWFKISTLSQSTFNIKQLRGHWIAYLHNETISKCMSLYFI